MTTIERLDNHPAGVEATVRINLADPWKLGHWIASLPSDEQAALLHGFQVGLEELGPLYRGKQLLYIREDANKRGIDLSNLVEMFNGYLSIDGKDDTE